MKLQKKSALLLLFSITLSCLVPATSVNAGRAVDIANQNGNNVESIYQPEGSIITEFNTGQILWQEDPDVPASPASMSKLMTALLIYEAVADGKLTMETEVPVSPKALDISNRYALSNNKMKQDAVYTVSELINLLLVPSSAAATYMLTDLLEPDPDKYAVLLNEKAASLGMTNTTYYNAIGVTNEYLVPYQPKNQPLTADNVTSPLDYALLSTYFVEKFPELLERTKHPTIIVKQGTPFEEHFKTYQFSLEGAKHELKGSDGIKTGSGTHGFNLAATAKRENTRLVEVILGVGEWTDQIGEDKRHLIANPLMEQAFQNFEYKLILPKGTHTIGETEFTTQTDFWDCVPKGQKVPLILKDNRVSVDLKRTYLPGYSAPSVAYKEVEPPLTLPLILLITALLILLLCSGIFLYRYHLWKKKTRRRRRRHRNLPNR